MPPAVRCWREETATGSLQPPCVQLTLHEIAMKIASKYLANARHQTSVRPGFIGEMTRPNTNSGVSRQKLASVGRKSWRQCSRDHAAASGGFQNGTRRKRSHSLGNILGEVLEYQRDEIAIVVFRDRTSKHLVGFRHCFFSCRRTLGRVVG